MTTTGLKHKIPDSPRIRDKIAASKKKGMWMGGRVPLGYKSKDKKLLIHQDEATIIKSLFQLYVQHRNVRLVKHHADQLGYKTREKIDRSGESKGGQPLSRGHIYAILSNPVYRGKIQHKDQIHSGEHEAIIDEGIWKKVQYGLKSNAISRKTTRNSQSSVLLSGLLFDAEGQKLVPHHANKKGQKYHYYVSQRLKSENEYPGWRIPAKEIERIVQGTMIGALESGAELIKHLHPQNMPATTISNLVASGKTLVDQFSNADHIERKALYQNTIKTITLSDEEISISLNPAAFNIDPEDNAPITITRPMSIRRRGHEMKLIVGGESPLTTNKDPGLIKLIANAHALRCGLEDGSIPSILAFAKRNNIDHGDARRMLPLGYLAPDIIDAIISGHQPADLTTLRLKSGYDLPIRWDEQRVHLGFPN